MSAIFRAPDSITEADVAAMRAHWHAAEADEREPSIRPRDLRFCRVGEVLTHSTVGDFYRHVVALLISRLDDELAPCTRRQSGDPSSVRSVHRSAVDWSTMEPREWTSLERAGLPRAMRVRLEAGEPLDAPEGESDDSHARAIEAARALLAHAPDGTPAERAEWAAERAREVIYGRFKRDESGWPAVSEYDPHGYNTDRDGVPLRNGQTRYFRDHHGRLQRAVIYTNMNAMWMCVYGGSATWVSGHSLFSCDRPDLEPRRVMPDQEKRLNAELSKAIKAKDYRRVEKLGRALQRCASTKAA